MFLIPLIGRSVSSTSEVFRKLFLPIVFFYILHDDYFYIKNNIYSLASIAGSSLFKYSMCYNREKLKLPSQKHGKYTITIVFLLLSYLIIITLLNIKTLFHSFQLLYLTQYPSAIISTISCINIQNKSNSIHTNLMKTYLAILMMIHCKFQYLSLLISLYLPADFLL